MQSDQFHHYERHYELLKGRIWPERFPRDFSKKVKNIGRTFKLTPRNKQILNEFRIFNENDERMSVSRNKRILELVAHLGEMFEKDFDAATKKDIEEVVSKIASNPIWNPSTKSMHKQALKQFYKWLQGNNEEFPEIVRWIKRGSKRGLAKLPEDMISEEEVMKIIETCNHPMRKAIIAVLWETGARIGEIGVANIRSIQFNGSEATIILRGKTGMRQVLLILSVPFLRDWLTIHPQKNNKDAPLFSIVSHVNYGKRMGYAAIRRTIQEAMERAGIQKPFNPHHWRHSRATYLAQHLTEAQLCTVMGWAIGSNMPATYIHLSGRDTNESIRRIYGLEKSKEESESKLKPIECPFCKETNQYSSQTCQKCFNPLTLEARINQKDKVELLSQKIIELQEAFTRFGKLSEAATPNLNEKIKQIKKEEIAEILKNS